VAECGRGITPRRWLRLAHPPWIRITGLTKVFGIYQTVDQAIAARK
jgi:hypothetical protein